MENSSRTRRNRQSQSDELWILTRKLVETKKKYEEIFATEYMLETPHPKNGINLILMQYLIKIARPLVMSLSEIQRGILRGHG